MDEIRTIATEESAENRARRIAAERDMIAEARAAAAVGRIVPSAAVRAWAESLGTDHELPVPFSGR